MPRVSLSHGCTFDPEQEAPPLPALVTSLCGLPRWASQGSRQITVADHSYTFALWVEALFDDEGLIALALLHDAAEMVLGHRSPVFESSPEIAAYRALERRLSSFWLIGYGLDWGRFEEIRPLHTYLEAFEAELLFPNNNCYDPPDVEALLARYPQLEPDQVQALDFAFLPSSDPAATLLGWAEGIRVLRSSRSADTG